MTDGTWKLSTALRVRGSKTAGNAAAATPYALTDGVQQALSFGLGDGAVTVFVSQFRTLVAGAAETHDLYDGSLLDVFGDPATFRVLRAYAVWVESGGDAAGLTVSNAASNSCPLWHGAAWQKTLYPDSPGDSGGQKAGLAVSSAASRFTVTNNAAVATTYGLFLAGTLAVSGVPTGGLLLTLTYP